MRINNYKITKYTKDILSTFPEWMSGRNIGSNLSKVLDAMVGRPLQKQLNKINLVKNDGVVENIYHNKISMIYKRSGLTNLPKTLEIKGSFDGENFDVLVNAKDSEAFSTLSPTKLYYDNVSVALNISSPAGILYTEGYSEFLKYPRLPNPCPNCGKYNVATDVRFNGNCWFCNLPLIDRPVFLIMYSVDGKDYLQKYDKDFNFIEEIEIGIKKNNYDATGIDEYITINKNKWRQDAEERYNLEKELYIENSSSVSTPFPSLTDWMLSTNVSVYYTAPVGNFIFDVDITRPNTKANENDLYDKSDIKNVRRPTTVINPSSVQLIDIYARFNPNDNLIPPGPSSWWFDQTTNLIYFNPYNPSANDWNSEYIVEYESKTHSNAIDLSGIAIGSNYTSIGNSYRTTMTRLSKNNTSNLTNIEIEEINSKEFASVI